MALETGTYISDLVVTNPTASDPKSAGDDHLRFIKSAIKTTFPNVAGAVTVTHTQINSVAGKADAASPTFTGVVTVPTPSNATDAASKGYCDGLAFATALPAQAGNAGKFVTTDGVTASWSGVPGATIYLNNNFGGF